MSKWFFTLIFSTMKCCKRSNKVTLKPWRCKFFSYLMLVLQITISIARIIIKSIRPPVELLGKIRGTDIFCSIEQYPVAIKTPGIIVICIGSDFLCFINANSVRERSNLNPVTSAKKIVQGQKPHEKYMIHQDVTVHWPLSMCAGPSFSDSNC